MAQGAPPDLCKPSAPYLLRQHALHYSILVRAAEKVWRRQAALLLSFCAAFSRRAQKRLGLLKACVKCHCVGRSVPNGRGAPVPVHAAPKVRVH